MRLEKQMGSHLAPTEDDLKLAIRLMSDAELNQVILDLQELQSSWLPQQGASHKSLSGPLTEQEIRLGLQMIKEWKVLYRQRLRIKNELGLPALPPLFPADAPPPDGGNAESS
jgi:hypothetical protein